MVLNRLRCEPRRPPADAHVAAPRVPEQPLGRSKDNATDDVPPDAHNTKPAPVVYGSQQADSVTNCSVMPVQSRPLSTGSLAHRVTTGSGDVDDEVMNMVSFEGCEELLRGSHLSVIMRDQASILSDRSGTAADYNLSKPTKIIDAFISHNWSVSRWLKWLCLSMHFNLRIATGLTFLVVSPLCVPVAYGWIPTYQPDFALYPRSYVFKLTFTPIFVLLLCFYRSIIRCCPTWSPLVFLDKTCIHQEDKEIQRQAIGKLGGFLCRSQTMIICYTEIYITRLWTVYEVASFMAMHSAQQLRVIPAMYPFVFVFSLMCIYTAGLVATLPEIAVGFYYTVHIFVFVFSYAIMVVFRRWGRSKIDIYEKVSAFSVRNCTCLYEDDRPLVYANITALMREIQGVGRNASEEDALDVFDNFVRNNLSGALVSSVGAYSIRYEHAAAIGCILSAAVVLDQLAGVAHGMPWRFFCNYALWYAVVGCFVFPAAFMGIATWADLCMKITGRREHLYLALGLVVVFVPVTLSRQVLDVMESWANESDFGFIFFVIFFVVSTAIARAAMNDSICPKRCRDKACQDEHILVSSRASQSQESKDLEKEGNSC